MLPPIDISNITKKFEESLKNKALELQNNLLDGDFAKMEDTTRSLIQEVYKEIVETVIK
ncbi:MAG: hypothetical protein ACPGVB_12770 [Chitinophagales bacterium]